MARKFWTALGSVLPEWKQVEHRKVSSSRLRTQFVHVHGVTLQALGRAGGDLLKAHPKDWEHRLKRLSAINWSRDNTELWQGRALVDGRITKGERNVVLVANVVKRALGIPLAADEKRAEKRSGKTALQEVAS